MEFSPRHRKINNTRGRCCVAKCNSKKNNNSNLSFHKVPKFGVSLVTIQTPLGETKVVDKRTEWLKRLNLEDKKSEMLVCSLHFSVNDYVLPDTHTKLRTLKKNAVPEYVKVTEEQRKSNIQRAKRQLNRSLAREKKSSVVKKCSSNNLNKNSLKHVMNAESSPLLKPKLSQSTFDRNLFLQKIDAGVSVADMLINVTEPDHHDVGCCEIFEGQLDNPDELYGNKSDAVNNFDQSVDVEEVDEQMDSPKEVDGDESYVAEQSGYDETSLCNDLSRKVRIDRETQVTSGDLMMPFCSCIKTDKDLMTMCNIKSFSILNEVVKAMDKYYPRKRKHSISTRESIILTCAKLKLDVSFSALGMILFREVSVVTIRNIFYDTVPKLANILQSVITRISKEEILQNMPKCFEKYQSTTSVLGCTEIKIQQPKCLKCSIKFYSHYKGDLTVKFMTEVTPGGIIVGVSEAFGGRASDKTIFNQTNTLQHMENTRDSVMVDKGFLIDDECAEKRIKLIRPPYLKSQSQLTEKDSTENRDIASARVHIERINQRIKQFNVLNHKLPWYFVNYIDDIFIICCGFANLGTPILSDDKFM